MDKDLEEALEALRDLANFAYELGYHELGYDPIQVVTEALHDKLREEVANAKVLPRQPRCS